MSDQAAPPAAAHTFDDISLGVVQLDSPAGVEIKTERDANGLLAQVIGKAPNRCAGRVPSSSGCRPRVRPRG